MAAIILAAVSLYSCQPGDSTVQMAVNERLNTSPNVSAEVKGGIVTLSGDVQNDSAKTAAETAVKGVNGVKSINNNIMVQPPVPPPPQEINAPADSTPKP